jgi:hypothetical protein
MASVLADYILDNGLVILDTLATHIYICSATDPTTYTEATSTFALGNKNFGAGAAFGAPAAGSPNGRKVTSNAITDGNVTGTGTAAKWAVVDSVNSRLYCNGALSATQAVTSGNTFTLAAFDIRIPNQ